MQQLTVSIKELAGMLSISERTLFHRLADGSIPRPFKLGRRSLWYFDEVAAWIEAGMPSAQQWQQKVRLSRKSASR